MSSRSSSRTCVSLALKCPLLADLPTHASRSSVTLCVSSLTPLSAPEAFLSSLTHAGNLHRAREEASLVAFPLPQWPLIHMLPIGRPLLRSTLSTPSSVPAAPSTASVPKRTAQHRQGDRSYHHRAICVGWLCVYVREYAM